MLLKLNIFIINIFLINFFITYVFLKKYPKYRIEKINFVYEKAAAQLTENPKRLLKLQTDLAVFDDLYLSLKHEKHLIKESSKNDYDEIDNKLELLLQRYNAENAIHALRMKYKYKKDIIYSLNNNNNNNEIDKRVNVFDDNRLQSIWNDIKNDKSISLTALDDLYSKLCEHDKKIKKYNILLRRIANQKNSTNHILNDDDDDFNKEEKQKLLANVKQMNIDIEDNINVLKNSVANIKLNPFQHNKVRLLWEKAINSKNLIPNELDAIKNELKHFERHLEKFDFYKAHLNEFEEFSRGTSKDNFINNENANELLNQHKKILHKIKKLEYYLNEKIRPNHSEL